MKKVIIIIISIIILLSLIIIFKKDDKSNNIDFKFVYDDFIDDDIEISNNEILLTSYLEYQDLVNKYYLNDTLKEEDFINNSYLVIFDKNYCDSETEVAIINYLDDTLEITYNKHKICGLCAPHTNLYFYKLEKIDKNVKLKTKIKKVKDEECDPNVAYKPILYLYPNQDMYIDIKLEHNNIITSYPKYNNGWKIYVDSNGNISYNNRSYYALYWDEYNYNNVDFSTGFYVSGENAINFLEEKLDIIGLNNREANEFIMYWLPILEENEHSIVYFELTSERESNNRLIISPKPDSMLRINMHIKKVDGYVKIKEQRLTSFNRYGFSIVEWGGTIHKEG